MLRLCVATATPNPNAMHALCTYTEAYPPSRTSARMRICVRACGRAVGTVLSRCQQQRTSLPRRQRSLRITALACAPSVCGRRHIRRHARRGARCRPAATALDGRAACAHGNMRALTPAEVRVERNAPAAFCQSGRAISTRLGHPSGPAYLRSALPCKPATFSN
jgi:hypothetical protein